MIVTISIKIPREIIPATRVISQGLSSLGMAGELANMTVDAFQLELNSKLRRQA